jgi:hypothetical protein
MTEHFHPSSAGGMVVAEPGFRTAGIDTRDHDRARAIRRRGLCRGVRYGGTKTVFKTVAFVRSAILPRGGVPSRLSILSVVDGKTSQIWFSCLDTPRE